MLIGGGHRVALGELGADGHGVLIAQRRPVEGEGVAAVVAEQTGDGVQDTAHDAAGARWAEAGEVDGGRVAFERADDLDGQRMRLDESERDGIAGAHAQAGCVQCVR
jgi:hypothetical protein